LSQGLFAAFEDKDGFVGLLAIQSLKKVFSGNAPVVTLLETLQQTQVEPNRWVAGYLQQRQRTFRELEAATGIRMPVVAMKSPTCVRRQRLMLIAIVALLVFVAVVMNGS
jgi:hypothetical protein